jgi:hypothetical protein
MMRKVVQAVILLGLILLCASCGPAVSNQTSHIPETEPDTIVYTIYSQLPNHNVNFNSPAAINRIAQIENEHFRKTESGTSPYYGTVWREWAELDSSASENGSLFDQYLARVGGKADSMHCTIYAVEGLKAGLGEHFATLEKSHLRVWKEHEHAGWSIAWLLVKEWNWKAYLVLDSNSAEFTQCERAFRRKGAYPVWKQPDIPLEALYIRGKDDSLIVKVLDKNEFGWGFSHQGIHTWITRFRQLKECVWAGAPGREYDLFEIPLFSETPFLNYYAYGSHVLVFPPKE